MTVISTLGRRAISGTHLLNRRLFGHETWATNRYNHEQYSF